MPVTFIRLIDFDIINPLAVKFFLACHQRCKKPKRGSYMKHSLSKLLFVLFISLYINCSADCDCAQEEIRFSRCPKTYVLPEQIDFNENIIFVRVHETTMQTESLHTDAHGIFFENVRVKECGISQWLCLKTDTRGMVCETCNWVWNNWCFNCRKER
jgi:hypothetical protein